jgi:hypothetical protein
MEPDLVRFVESRAMRLRIAYTHATIPKALLASVAAAEQRIMQKLGPEGLPSCHGTLFAGPYDPLCAQCDVQMQCAQRFAGDLLADTQARIASSDPPALGAALNLDPKGISLAQALTSYQQGEHGTFWGYQRLPAPPKERIPTAMYMLPRPPAWLAWGCIVGSRARLRSWDRDIRRVDQPGSCKNLAIAKAGHWKPRDKSQAWNDRWVRERKRNKVYRHLKRGMTLRRMHRGILHEVYVGHRCYVYDTQPYPTLYAVVQAIAGSVACPLPPGKDDVRPEGVKWTALKSPLIFFNRSFRQLVNLMPDTPRRKRKRAAKKTTGSKQ